MGLLSSTRTFVITVLRIPHPRRNANEAFEDGE